MKNIAIITARSGSKGLPHKNIKPLAGKPLMAWTIEAAVKSGMFDTVMVSTDSEEYAKIAREYGAEVPFLRSEEMSGDRASFKEGLSFAEDKIFVMSFLEHVRCVRTVSSVVYSYFLRPSSLSSDMRSDSHIEQIFRLLECYEPVLRTLETTYPHSSRISELYHQDLVGRYVCRILDIYASRKSGMLEAEKISILYNYIDGDRKASVFGLRLGQVPNMILYNIGRPGFTVSFYRFTSGVSTFLKLKFHR